MTLDATTWGIILAVLGITVSIYFGLKSVRSKSQRQSARDNSVAIQSGRDTTINER
jgi:hypothetical protein